jgi:sulfide dehydrogenase [flavocytochrome c] flavoprotein chain
MYEQIPALNDEAAQQRVLHAWKAGPQTVALRQQLADMRDGGVFVISIPMAPLKCPPAPYERACQVANYFQRAKPRSKIIILDANEDVASEKPLFTRAWNEQYKGMIEYRNNSELRDVDLKALSARLDFDTVRADVLNVLPPMKAARVAESAGLITANGRWCGVDWLTMESIAAPGVHVLGDATLPAPLMAKSGQIANQHGRVAAAAIGALMHGREPAREAQMRSICYSFIDDNAAAHVASLHRYDATEKTFKVVPGSTNVSATATDAEGRDAFAWAKNIWAEMLG